MQTEQHYIRLTLEVEKDGDQYAAVCRELDVASCGDTIEEALSNLHEALEVHLTNLALLGERERVFRERGITTFTDGAPAETSVTVRDHVLITAELVAV